MNHSNTKKKMKTETKAKVWRFTGHVFGLPLMYIGVAILVGAFFLDKISNALLITAIVLEIVGAVAHFRKSLP